MIFTKLLNSNGKAAGFTITNFRGKSIAYYKSHTPLPLYGYKHVESNRLECVNLFISGCTKTRLQGKLRKVSYTHLFNFLA